MLYCSSQILPTCAGKAQAAVQYCALTFYLPLYSGITKVGTNIETEQL
jgi:hypothetical protein